VGQVDLDSVGPPPRILPESAGDASILVVAEHALVRAGLRAILDGTPGLLVVGEVADIDSATRAAARIRPDAVLLGAPPADGPARRALTALRRALPESCVLCLGAGEERDELQCVPFDAGVTEFCAALGSVLGDRCGACLLRPRCPGPRVAVALSRRERQVAIRVSHGMSTKQIAAELGVRPRTVNTYRESLARKLGASSPAVVTRYVLEHGLSSVTD
jgi:two-component system, NarL family, response regulator NreC